MLFTVCVYVTFLGFSLFVLLTCVVIRLIKITDGVNDVILPVPGTDADKL